MVARASWWTRAPAGLVLGRWLRALKAFLFVELERGSQALGLLLVPLAELCL